MSLPSELLGGHRAGPPRAAHRPAARHGRVLRSGRCGWASRARCATPTPTRSLALLHTLGGACRGRLRLLTTRRDRPADPPAVAAWLLFDDGWHELRPGRDATSVLRRRDARDLGLLTLPLVEGVPSLSGAA